MIFKKKTKLDRQIDPYLQAGGRRFESDYLHPVKSDTYSDVSVFSFSISRNFVAVSVFSNVSFMLL